MEVSNTVGEDMMVENAQPAVVEAPQTAGDEKGTTSIPVADDNGSMDENVDLQGPIASAAFKRAAEDLADSDHIGDVEPAPKRARADEQLVGDGDTENPGDTAIVTVGQEQEPVKPETHVRESAAAAVAQSPGKARTSPIPSGPQSPATKRAGDVVLRLLVLDRSVATIIGKGGSSVKAIQNSSGARVQAMPAVPGVEERVIVISNPEDAQQAVSGAERALHAIQNKLMLDLEPAAAAVMDRVQQELAPQPTALTTTEPATEDVVELASTAVKTRGAEDASQQQDQPECLAASTAVDAEEPAAAPQQTSAVGGESESTLDATPNPAATVTSTGVTPAGDAPVLEQPTAVAGDAGGEVATNICSSAAADAEQTTTAVDASKAAANVAEDVVAAVSAVEQPALVAAEASDEAAGADASKQTSASTEQQATAVTGAQQPHADVPAPPVSPAAATIPALGGDSPAPPRSRSVQHVARMLVSPSQASSLLTAGAAGLRAIKEQSGAYVKVLQPEESPFCALDGDRVTQVVGSAEQVFRAVLLLGAHLRKHPALERPGGMHPGLSARVGGGRRYGGRGPHRSPPPPPPRLYGGQYGAHPGYGPAPPGYGPPVHAYGAAAGYGALPQGPPGYHPPHPSGAYGAPALGAYDQMYQGYGY